MQINILKKANCGKVSSPEKETLTYNIGNCDDEYYFRVTDNNSGGFFSHEWISLTELTAITATELAAIGSFLSGVGAVAIAIMAFYGVYRWREQATDKRDTLESMIEEHKEL